MMKTKAQKLPILFRCVLYFIFSTLSGRKIYQEFHSELQSKKQLASAKGAFFLESEIRFSNIPISPKKLFQKTILSLKFEIPAHNSKQLIQISSSG